MRAVQIIVGCFMCAGCILGFGILIGRFIAAGGTVPTPTPPRPPTGRTAAEAAPVTLPAQVRPAATHPRNRLPWWNEADADWCNAHGIERPALRKQS
jgi:hypothetical protein